MGERCQNCHEKFVGATGWCLCCGYKNKDQDKETK